MNREQPPRLEEDRKGFSLNFMPACWRAEIEAARAAGAGEPTRAAPQPTREPFDIQDAWQTVGELYRYIVALFGAPLAIAESLLLVKKSRRDILAWLGPVEALARRILLLRALSLPPTNEPPPKIAPSPLFIAFTDRAEAAIDPDSEKWRVRFCVMPYGVLRRKQSREKCADRRGGALAFNALPLARRIEALRRVLENPGPAIARLARLLATQPAAIDSAFRPYRPPATCVQGTLAAVQHELRLALNSS
jgi:hypothetical protein